MLSIDKVIVRVLFSLLVFTSFINANDTKKISLQLLWKHQFEFAGFYIAKEKGFYKDVGIDLDIKEYEFGIDITKDVLDGKSDFGIGRSSLILDKLNGKELSLLGVLYQSSPYVLMSLKRDDLKTVKDFKNKKIMLSDDLTEVAAISSMITSKGVGKKDYKEVPHSFNIHDLVDGKVDLMTTYISNEPYELEKSGIEYTIFNPKDYGFDFYADIVFTSNKLIKDNPTLVEDFHKASLKGWQYAFKNIDETVGLILRKYNSQNKTKEALKYEANILKKLSNKDNYNFGYLSELRVREIANIYRLLGMTSKSNKYLTNIIYQPWETNKVENLTNKEINYLNKNRVIKMCNNPNWEPIEFAKSGKMGKMSGISIDTMKLIGEKLNIKFENVPTNSWSESQQFLKDKKCDILPSAIKTAKREKYATFTKPYLNYKLAIITKDDKPLVSDVEDIIKQNKTIARKKGSGLISKLKRLYPNVKIVETKDYLESLQKVSKGEVYCTIATLPVASYYINKFALNNLHIAGYTDIMYKLSIAIRDDKPVLKSILDKALDQISQKEHKEIYDKWANVTIKEGFDWHIFINTLIVVFVIIFFAIYRQYLLNKQNKTLEKLVDEKTQELKYINENLEVRIKEEVEKNRIQEQQIFESKKMVQMGEMIGNIAHQWRQPLSAISTAASGLNLSYEYGIFKEEDIPGHMDAIVRNTKYLSETIDTFRDFIKEKKELKKVVLQDRIDISLNIIGASLQNNQIQLKNNIDYTKSIELTLVVGELSQVIINIINNAKDVLLEKGIDDAWIKLELEEIDNKAVITIEDNGGGIPENIMAKIFDPYFTTKHQSQGTGLGLHMSYKIITESLKGKLYVKNTQYGAKFFIELPLDKKEN